MTKDQILQGYLNLAYYGDLAYGVEAAAQHYFSVTAASSTSPQAALLAGLVQQPGPHRPDQQPREGPGPPRRRARPDARPRHDHRQGAGPPPRPIPVKKMLKVKYPQSNCAASSRAVLLQLRHGLPQGHEQPRARRPRQDRAGADQEHHPGRPDHPDHARPRRPEDGPASSSTSGCRSATSRAASAPPPASSSPAPARCWPWSRTPTYTTSKGSQSKGYTQVNWNVDRKYGGDERLPVRLDGEDVRHRHRPRERHPGQRHRPVEVRHHQEAGDLQPEEQGRAAAGRAGRSATTTRSAASRSRSRRPPPSSINTAFASLVLSSSAPTRCDKTMTQDGPAPGHRRRRSSATPASVTLGAGDHHPADPGRRPTRRWRRTASTARRTRSCRSPRTTRSRSRSARTACKQVIDKDVAKGATELLKGVIKNGTGTRRQARRGRPAAGKTGTTDNHDESWFVGYTPQLADGRLGRHARTASSRMKNIRLGGDYYGEVFGGTISAPIWQDIMRPRLGGTCPMRDFGDPSDKVLNGDCISVPFVSGMSVAGGDSRGSRTPASPCQVAGQHQQRLSEGLVVYTTPERHGAARLDDRPLHLDRLRPGAARSRRRPPKPKTTTEAKTGPRRLRTAEEDPATKPLRRTRVP